MVVPPSVNATVPPFGGGATVAVNVTLIPYNTGCPNADEMTVVVVLAKL